VIGAIAVIAALAAEALAVYTGAELFAAGYENDHQGAVTAVTFVSLALVAYGLPRAVGDLGLSGRNAAIAIAAVSYVAIYGAMRLEFAGDLALWDWSWMAGFVRDAEATTRASGPAVIGGMLMLGIWARSSWRSADGVDIETLTRTIGIPFAVVTTVVIFAAASDRASEVARAAVAFYVVAVIALALSQSALSGATIGTLRAGSVTASLLAGTAVVTGVCVVVFTVVFGILGDQFGSLLSDAINGILFVIFTPIAWVLEKVMSFLLGGERTLPEIQVPEQIRPIEDDGSTPGEQSSRAVIAFGRMLILLATVAVGVAIVAFFTRLRAAGRAARPDAPAASTAGSLGADLAAGLRSLFSRSHRTPAPMPSTPAIQLYRDVVARAERGGRPRAVGETAEEYAPALLGLFRTPVTDEITYAFEQARYAGREPDPALVAELERRWRSTHIE
jgi:hypothetical protein